MKNRMKYFVYILLGLLSISSCQQEELIQTQFAGFLSLKYVKVGGVEVNGIQTKSGVDAQFVIEIWKDGSLYNNHKYEPGKISSAKIELPVGLYLLKVYTPNYKTSSDVLFADGSLGEAIYYKEQIFQIEAAKVTYPNVLVPMINVGVCLKSDLPLEFHNFSLDATVGDRTINIKPGDIGYFPILAVGNSMTYILQAKNDDGELLKTEANTFSKLEASTVYEIAYSFSTKSFYCMEQ